MLNYVICDLKKASFLRKVYIADGQIFVLMLFFHSDAVPMCFVVTDILPWVGKYPEDQSRRSYQAFQLCPEAKTWDDLYLL